MCVFRCVASNGREVYISEIKANSPTANAEGAELVTGLRIWKINGIDVSNKTRDFIIEQIGKSEGEFTLATKYDPKG